MHTIGEDPEFLAHALVTAERISQVPELVYRYRKYPKSDGSQAAGLRNLTDAVQHAASVKSLYERTHANAWTQGYGPHAPEAVH